MITAFAPVMTALSNANSSIPKDPTSGTACMPPFTQQSGPPNVQNTTYCMNWFGSLFNSTVKNSFAGVMGLYMALKNNSLGSNNLLSLNDLYAIFKSGNLLGMKLTDQSNFTWGVNYTPISGSNGNLNALLNDPNPSGSYTGNFTLNPTFINSSSTPLSYSAAAALYNAATFGFNDSFMMFETIPTASNIHDYVFKSAYHVDFNPTGSSTYNAAGGKSTSASVVIDPIFAR